MSGSEATDELEIAPGHAAEGVDAFDVVRVGERHAQLAVDHLDRQHAVRFANGREVFDSISSAFRLSVSMRTTERPASAAIALATSASFRIAPSFRLGNLRPSMIS
jgi:hypothetical protein